MQDFSIVIIDDEDGIRFGLKKLFNKEGFITYAYGNYETALVTVKEKNIDVVVLDIRLNGDKNGIDVLKELKLIDNEIIVIMITGYGSIENAVLAIKEGAADYIIKPVDNKNIIDVINKNLEIRKLKNENTFLKEELHNQIQKAKFITDNQHLKNLLQNVDKIKNNPVSILITGKSGTGKEVLARYIHYSSNRKDEKIVCINCAALSDTLLLSELFGHEKGAFTGALNRKLGKFEMAHKGTLFLDEIGDMALDTQAKLLRVLEDNYIERLGGNKKIFIDTRVIAATNKDLAKLIKEGRFREDLYYRINVISFHLPVLKDRKEDILKLANFFIKKYNLKYQKNIRNIAEDVLQKFCSYNWPGNVRELNNIINQAVLMTEGDIIDLSSLKKSVFNPGTDLNQTIKINENGTLKEKIDEITGIYERKIIQESLEKNNFNKTKTAEVLAITRKTLAGKIKKYNL